MTYSLGIIGAGNMAEAIARGVILKQLFSAQQIIASDPAESRRALFSSELHIQTTADNAEVARHSSILLLSTKPYQLKEVLSPLGAVMSPDTLVISIAAGITTSAIAAALSGGKPWRVVRAMPNTPMLVGQGATGICPGSAATAADLASTRRIFESAGEVVEVPEDKLDAVTALSGSGPAYFYYLVEAMTEAGVAMGLSSDDAQKLARKTCLGAGLLLSQSPDTPAELRRKVTTPGGTTHAAISFMESQGFSRIIVEALAAAERRGKELGKS